AGIPLARLHSAQPGFERACRPLRLPGAIDAAGGAGPSGIPTTEGQALRVGGTAPQTCCLSRFRPAGPRLWLWLPSAAQLHHLLARRCWVCRRLLPATRQRTSVTESVRLRHL